MSKSREILETEMRVFERKEEIVNYLNARIHVGEGLAVLENYKKLIDNYHYFLELKKILGIIQSL